MSGSGPLPPFIIDTNVFLSALGRPAMLPARVVDFCLAQKAVVASPALLSEYLEVALRTSSVRFHRKSQSEVEAAIARLTSAANIVDPQRADIAAPDPDDQHLWDLLAAVPNTILITGDRRLRDNPPPGHEVLSPREFVAHYLGVSEPEPP